MAKFKKIREVSKEVIEAAEKILCLALQILTATDKQFSANEISNNINFIPQAIEEINKTLSKIMLC